jgi:hypothetical protein
MLPDEQAVAQFFSAAIIRWKAGGIVSKKLEICELGAPVI